MVRYVLLIQLLKQVTAVGQCTQYECRISEERRMNVFPCTQMNNKIKWKHLISIKSIIQICFLM